jgi:SAM-dependent methyltransferase
MGHDTKPFEKAYLTRSGSSAWEAAKPFSPAGADTLRESAQLLHDFAVAMMALHPDPDDLVLDLGAGGCWSSELLRRFNRRTVAVDISVDMLRIGRSRSTPIPAVAGDLESLPFRTASFDKALCLNALHHVPSVAQALKEIARVLTPDGVALFSEPGSGHATARTSVSAVRDFGVLEQEVLFDPFARACRDAGFQDVRLKALAYAVPIFDLTPEEWTRWSTPASRKRPVRALMKMWRAGMELVGLGKQGALFDETFERSLTRALFGAMRDHPLIIASKLPIDDARALPTLAGNVKVEGISDDVLQGSVIRASVIVTNRGSRVWRASSRSGIGHVTLGVQLLDAQRRVINRDFYRRVLTSDILPGQSQTVAVEFPSPENAGRYVAKFDLVAEGITWFESAGSQPAHYSISVRDQRSGIPNP